MLNPCCLSSAVLLIFLTWAPENILLLFPHSANTDTAEGEQSCCSTPPGSNEDAADGATVCYHNLSCRGRTGAALAECPQAGGAGDAALQKQPGQLGQVRSDHLLYCKQRFDSFILLLSGGTIFFKPALHRRPVTPWMYNSVKELPMFCSTGSTSLLLPSDSRLTLARSLNGWLEPADSWRPGQTWSTPLTWPRSVCTTISSNCWWVKCFLFYWKQRKMICQSECSDVSSGFVLFHCLNEKRRPVDKLKLFNWNVKTT